MITTPKAEEKKGISIFPESTPNPNSMKFIVIGQEILPHGGLDFPNIVSAAQAPLAVELFRIPDVAAVFLGTNFVTVTKRPETDWPTLMDVAMRRIKNYLDSGGEIVSEALLAAPVQKQALNDQDAEVVKKIQDILDNEIRPAIARDGGDVSFEGYEDGTVTLRLRGACSSCPSSIMTLKMGIENRMKQMIPEVQEVVSI
ncbi:MAG: NifU family protein [bacterium]|nr:NifU family protein [bacterium]